MEVPGAARRREPAASASSAASAGDAAPPGADRVGIRELRNSVAAVVRRAAAGERIVVTVDGVPTAQLGPLHPEPRRPSLDDLIAAGLVLPSQRRDRPAPPDGEDVPVDARPDAVLDELRGS